MSKDYTEDFENYIRHTEPEKKEKSYAWATAIGLGFNAENDIFAKNSWYFRNALVRANYTNIQKEIAETSEYLERFFRNLLLGENNELKNRYCHIDYKLYAQKADEQSSPKSGLGSPKSSSKLKTSDKIFNLIKSNPKITTQEIAENIGITKRAVLKNLSNMKDRVIHTGPYNGGSWEILENR